MEKNTFCAKRRSRFSRGRPKGKMRRAGIQSRTNAISATEFYVPLHFGQDMNRENGFAGMIIEFDSIRTACELWKSSVRYARFRRYGHSVRRLLSSVVERVLRKDEVGSSILPEGNFFVFDRLRFCPIFMLRDVEPAMPHPTRPSASRNSTRLGRRARSRPGWSPYVFFAFHFLSAVFQHKGSQVGACERLPMDRRDAPTREIEMARSVRVTMRDER